MRNAKAGPPRKCEGPVCFGDAGAPSGRSTASRPGGASRDDLVTHRVESNFAPVVQIQLMHEVHTVGLDSVGADIENGGRFFIGSSFGEQLQDLPFAFSQKVVGVLNLLSL